MEERKKRFLQGKKCITAYIPEELFNQFNDKLKKDNISKQELIETAIYQYLNDELRINKIK